MITPITPYNQQPYNVSFSSKKMDSRRLARKVFESIKEINLLGAGNDSRAYIYDGNPRLVVLVPRSFRKKKSGTVDFLPVERFESNFNYGQAILASNNGIKILKRVFGEEHSFHNWLGAIARFDRLKKIPIPEAQQCLKGLKKISVFPLESYIDFARKIKFLNENNKVVDCINPNNVLINFRKKQFNIIDLWEKGKHGNNGVSGEDHMITLLLDGLLHGRLLKSLPMADAIECRKVSRTIIQKCKEASQIVGLPRTKDEIYRVFADCDGKYHHGLVGRYKTFNEIYNL